MTISFAVHFFGYFLVGLALNWFYKITEFVKHANWTEGTVIELDSENDVYYPVVEYSPRSGKVIRFKASVGSSPPSYKEGEIVRVYFDPKKPGEAKLHGIFTLFFGPILIGAIGVIVVFASFTITN